MPIRPNRDTWEVSVSRNGENLVVIGSNHLSGKPEFSEQDAQVIRDAAQHLLSFIGAEPPVSFDVDGGSGEMPAPDKPANTDPPTNYDGIDATSSSLPLWLPPET